MKKKSIRIHWLVLATLFLCSTNIGWANNFTGAVFTGKVKSLKSGKSWTANLKIVSYNQSSGRVEGEIEWPSLNSVHKITGKLTDSHFTFKEVEYIRKGSANLNCQYTTTISGNKISGTWSDPGSDNGTIELIKKVNEEKAAPQNNFTGAVFTGKAKSSKSGKSWTANVKIVSYNQSSGRVEGEIEWPSLNSVHKITGKLTDSHFTFKEVEYIRKGSANLNCQYTTTISGNKISGTWSDPGSDNGTIELYKK
ncbi:hypothetical protein DSECCO2_288980 [anaerobic digester metagenome]